MRHISRQDEATQGPKSKQKNQTPQLLLLGISQTPKLNNHDMYAEDVEQTHAGSVFAALVSVNLCEPCLVDSVGRVLLVSLTPLVSTVPLQWDQDQFSQLICMLLLFHICCWISVLAVAGFSPEKVEVGH